MNKGHIGTSMVIVKVPRKKRKKRNNRISTNHRTKQVRGNKKKPRYRATPVTDVKVDDNMAALKEQAIREGKYLGK